MVDGFSEDSNPMTRCGNPGPPKAMLLPYPVSITRPDDDHVVFERELMKEVRTVHIDHEHEELKKEPSKLGYSVGHFEGQELVVETSHFIADRWGTHTGIDSSEQKRLTERFTLADGGVHLLARITVEDPVYLAEPVTFRASLEKTGGPTRHPGALHPRSRAALSRRRASDRNSE